MKKRILRVFRKVVISCCLSNFEHFVKNNEQKIVRSISHGSSLLLFSNFKQNLRNLQLLSRSSIV